MDQLVFISILLVAVGFVSYLVGAIKLAKFAFRISGGAGIGVLLFPPYTFYFAMFKLEQSGKELPTAMAAFGLVTTLAMSMLTYGIMTEAPVVPEAQAEEYVAPASAEAPAEEAAKPAEGTGEANANAEQPAEGAAEANAEGAGEANAEQPAAAAE